MFADLFKLTPKPVVGGRVVRPLLPKLNPAVAQDIDQKRAELSRFLVQIEAVRDRRTKAKERKDRAGHERENREYKQIEYHIRTLQKQIEKLEDE